MPFVVRQGEFVLSRYGEHRQIALLPEVMTAEQAEVWTKAEAIAFPTEDAAKQAAAVCRVRRPRAVLTVETRP